MRKSEKNRRSAKDERRDRDRKYAYVVEESESDSDTTSFPKYSKSRLRKRTPSETPRNTGHEPAVNDYSGQPRAKRISSDPSIGYYSQAIQSTKYSTARTPSRSTAPKPVRHYSSDCSSDNAGSDMESVRKTPIRRRSGDNSPINRTESLSRTYRSSSLPSSVQGTERSPVRQHSTRAPTPTPPLGRSDQHHSFGGNGIGKSSGIPSILRDIRGVNDDTISGDEFASDLDDIQGEEMDDGEYTHYATTSPGQEICQCLLKPIKTFPTVIAKAHIQVVGLSIKERLLHGLDRLAGNPAVVLKRLRMLSPSTALEYQVKADSRKAITFRLFFEDPVDINAVESFVAVSYRRKKLVRDRGHSISLPLEPHLFKAVLEERQAPTEGLWVDQICINSETPGEQALSISSMDVI